MKDRKKQKPKVEIKFEVSEPRFTPPNSPRLVTAAKLFKAKDPDNFDAQIDHAIYQLEMMNEKECKK